MKRNSGYLCVLSVFCFFCLHSVWLAVGTNVWNYHFYDVVIFLMLFIVTVGLYVIIIYTINYMNACSESDQVKLHSRFLLDQVKNYESSEEKNSRFRHDVLHHLLHLASLVDAGEPEAALDYIKEYDSKILELSPAHYSKHPAINNILSAYAAKFKENNIPFDIHCNITESLAMNDLDMVSLLGNMLENALHGCQEAEDAKKADIYLSLKEGKLVVLCENTCSPKLELEAGLPKNKSIGVSSMLSVCSKYKGYLSYSADNGICSVSAVLSL